MCAVLAGDSCLVQQLLQTPAEPRIAVACRNKGVVKDMKWTSSGEKICIAYDDGAVIVGSVDGNRLWGKDLSMQLSLLEWSPDGRFILFCNAASECHTYDSNGNAVAKVPLYCNEGYVGEYAAAPHLAGTTAATAAAAALCNKELVLKLHTSR
jgi:hypothetical protein